MLSCQLQRQDDAAEGLSVTQHDEEAVVGCCICVMVDRFDFEVETRIGFLKG